MTAGTLDDWVRHILGDSDLAGMGHGQKPTTNDLGLGWLYYGLSRVIDPHIVVVIGSYRGFVPLVIGRALADNGTNGQVHFVDPSLVDDHWRDPERVQSHFSTFGVDNVRHHCMTTQEFVVSQTYDTLSNVDLVFIDGYHSFAQARFDFDAFAPRLSARGIVLFHDSIRVRSTHIYGPDKAYEHRVRDVIDELRTDPSLQVLDLPFGDGLTLVRRPAWPEVLLP